MKTLAATRIPIDFKDYKMRSAKEGDYHTLVSESTLVYEGDTLMIAYVELDLDCTEIVDTLQRIKYEKNFRSNGLPTTSRIFGFSPMQQTLTIKHEQAVMLQFKSQPILR